MSRAFDLIAGEMERGSFPSFSYIVARGSIVLEESAGGSACVTGERTPATLDTIYDLASLTKPLVTTLLSLILRRRRVIKFEDPVRRYIPQYEWDGKREIEIRHLLTHTSGLPDWEPLYLFGFDRKDIFRGLDRIGLVSEPGVEAMYSCLGYIQTGRIIEHAAGTPLDKLFAELISRPLALETAGFNPSPSLFGRIAATETGNEFERLKCGDRAAGYGGFRRDIIRGVVHDQNSFALGGVAGNAGLFATARDVLKIAAEILSPQLIMHRDDAGLYFSNQTGSSEDHRSIGLQMQTARDSVAGEALSNQAGAHTGFTGTSIAIDPSSELICMLLTNRGHPEYREVNMNDIRRRFHSAAAADAGTVR